MKWFKHFTTAHNSNDLTKVRMKYGADGYAIYWYCLELIAGDLGQSDDITFELKHDAEVIGYNLKIDSARVEEIMRYMVALELLENSEGTISCLKLAKYLDKKTTRNPTIHKIIDASGVVPDSPRQSPDCPEVSPLDTDTDTDTDIKTLAHFDAFWSLYPKKRSKGQAEKAWQKLTQPEKQSAIDNLSARVGHDTGWLKNNGEFIPYPATYLNAKGWEDDWNTAPTDPYPTIHASQL